MSGLSPIKKSLLLIIVASSLAYACAGEVGTGQNNPTASSGGKGGGKGGSANTIGQAMPEPGEPAAKPSSTPEPAPDIIGRGPFDCPTVDAPPYGVEAQATLSSSYRTSCASCHGGAGEGKGLYPAIPGKLTESTFIEKVRNGSENMPKFGVDFVSEAQLKSDFAILSKPKGNRSGDLSAGGESQWSQTQVDEKYARGLVMWRKAGSVDGQACANCHAPDGIDLALIGFRDDAILRRAHKHLDPADALVVLDFIHAQRRRFNLKQTCSTDWRPFQPMGEVLPGKTASERDIAFMRFMKKRNPRLFVDTVVTLDDAKLAWAELQGIDIRQIPIPTPLPRWTEDRFNGSEHKTNNDWIPGLPSIPNAPAAYYAKQDAYVANPTDEGMRELVDIERKDTTDGGYSTAYNAGTTFNGCGNYDRNKATYVVDYLKRDKRDSMIVAQHLFRMKILGKPSAFDQQVRSPSAPVFPNPMWQIGQRNAEPSVCAGGFNSAQPPFPDVLSAFPTDMRAELSAHDENTKSLMDLSIELADPWMTLGNLFDQGFATTTPNANPFNYWALHTFPHKVFFLPLTYTHRRAIQSKHWELYGKATGLPTHPLLDGSRVIQFQRKIETAAPHDELNYEGYKETGADANLLKGNLIRMTLLLQKDLLQKGAAVFQPQELRMDHFTSFARQMKIVLSDPVQAPLKGKAALYTTAIESLAAEVGALAARAPVATGNGPVGGN